MKQIPPYLDILSVVLSVVADLKRMAEETESKDICVLVVSILLLGKNKMMLPLPISNHLDCGY